MVGVIENTLQNIASLSLRCRVRVDWQKNSLTTSLKRMSLLGDLLASATLQCPSITCWCKSIKPVEGTHTFFLGCMALLTREDWLLVLIWDWVSFRWTTVSLMIGIFPAQKCSCLQALIQPCPRPCYVPGLCGTLRLVLRRTGRVGSFNAMPPAEKFRMFSWFLQHFNFTTRSCFFSSSFSSTSSSSFFLF